MFKLPDSYCVKTKAYSYALYVYIFALPLPIEAFGIGANVANIIIFSTLRYSYEKINIKKHAYSQIFDT